MTPREPGWIVPRWPAPARVHALLTTRAGGHSLGPYSAGGAGGMNLGLAGDDATAVARNRETLRAVLPGEPVWLEQVHGTQIVDAARTPALPRADGAFSTQAAVVCCVLTADCLPVLLAERDGRGVAIAHAGWRGLAAGVIQNAAHSLRHGLDDDKAQLLAYLGPAIGPAHFEVGAEVLAAMRESLPGADRAFVSLGAGKYRADLFELARQALEQAGVDSVHGGGTCTVSDPERFYSYRRDRVTGRQAALIWLQD